MGKESIKRNRVFRWRRLSWPLAAAVALHLAICFYPVDWSTPAVPIQPKEPIAFEFIRLPKPSTAVAPKAPVKAKPKKSIRQQKSSEKNSFRTRTDSPVPRMRLERPKTMGEMFGSWRPKPAPRAPPAKRRDRAGQFVEYQDGSVTLRNAELARSAHRPAAEAGVQVDESISVDDQGRVHDGSETVATMEKKLLAQIPRLGAHSPAGLDLGRFDWYAKTLGASCGIYRDGQVKGSPDGVTLVIDSSGSMTKNRYTSPATTCGYTVALSAIESNQSTGVGVINFSSLDHVVAETRDLGLIADGITKASGGGTFLPGLQLKNYIKSKGRRDIVVITDSHIQNYRSALPHFREALARDPRNQGVLIVIGDRSFTNDAAIRQFIWAGFKVQYHARLDRDKIPDSRPIPRPYRSTL